MRSAFPLQFVDLIVRLFPERDDVALQICESRHETRFPIESFFEVTFSSTRWIARSDLSMASAHSYSACT